jgi:hypothetical protein
MARGPISAGACWQGLDFLDEMDDILLYQLYNSCKLLNNQEVSSDHNDR